MKIFLTLILLTLSHAFSAQKQACEEVLVSGKLIDTLFFPSFYNAMLINRNTKQGTFGQANGKFSFFANNNDTIKVSVKGYDLISFIVIADSNCQSLQNVFVTPKARSIGEVTIRPLKSIQQIKEEREELSLRDSRTVTGANIIASPITALYERYSKRMKSIKRTNELKFKDKQAEVLQDLFRVYVAYEIIDLQEEEFKDFILFLNIDDEFLHTASDYELSTFIADKFEHYLRSLETEKPNPIRDRK